MPDIFLSYAREDRERVAPLVRLIESAGLSVWWDGRLSPGDSFENMIDKAILASKCVIVVWSRHSIDSQWVRSEALEGLERHILIPVLIDDVRVPVAFRQMHSVNFLKWPVHYEPGEYESLIRAIRLKVEGADFHDTRPDDFLVRGRRALIPLVIITIIMLAAFAYWHLKSENSPDPVAGDHLQARALSDDPVTYRKYLQAQDRIRRGEREDVSDAIRLLESVVDQAPDFAPAYTLLCQSYLALYEESNDVEDYQHAEHSCSRSLELNPENRQVNLVLGRLFAVTGETARSEAAYRSALTDQEFAVSAYIGLGTLYMNEGRIVDAELAYKKAVELAPTSIDAQTALGSFFFRQGMYFQSAETYTRVTELAPNNAMAWNNLGASRMMDGDFKRALDAWQQATKLNKYSGAYSNMGYALYLDERFAEAAEYVQRALDENPNDHRLWGNLGDMLRFIPGREQQARVAYNRAITLAEENLKVSPESPALLGRTAVYYAALNDRAKALETIELAMRHAQNDMYVLFDIAVAYSILGDDENSGRQLQLAKAAGYPAVLSDADPQFR